MTQTCVCVRAYSGLQTENPRKQKRLGYIVPLCVYVLHLCVCLLHLCLPLCVECLPVHPAASRTRQMNLRKVKGRNKILGAVFGSVADIFMVQ